MQLKPLTTGVSTFDSLITSNAMYIDKTKYIYELIKHPVPKRYFFSRPRRFGKSLTCSTLRAIFEGRKELFKDLYLGTTDYQWVTRPVIHLDFSEISHQTPTALDQGLHRALNTHAKEYGITLNEVSLKEKFVELVTMLGKTKGPIAIIIDEYDKPITDLFDNQELAEQSRAILKDFYGTMKGKSIDANMHFLFVTGICKFAKVALFSEFNNLEDITYDDGMAALVGYTEQEVKHYLSPHIRAFANSRNAPFDKTLEMLKTWYNGYRFSGSEITVYNPCSLHNCLTKRILKNYWFTTGTPTFLIKFIKQNPQIAVDIEKIDESFIANTSLEAFSIENYHKSYKTMLVQTGYLTFKSRYHEVKRGYTVGYANEEVRYSMIEQIMEFVGGITPEDFGEFGDRFSSALAADDLELFCKHMEDFIKLIPHDIRVDLEKFYQQVFFMTCVLYGKRPAAEVAAGDGYLDLLIEGVKKTFVVEMKWNDTTDVALAQIEHKRYWEPFVILPHKTIILAGVAITKTPQTGIRVLCKMKEL